MNISRQVQGVERTAGRRLFRSDVTPSQAGALGGFGLGGFGLGGLTFFGRCPRPFTICGRCRLIFTRHGKLLNEQTCSTIQSVRKCEELIPPQDGPLFPTHGHSFCYCEPQIADTFTQQCFPTLLRR